jgi:hypothetical protein
MPSFGDGQPEEAWDQYYCTLQVTHKSPELAYG